MISKTFALASSLALLAGGFGALPASAQHGNTANHQRERIAQLDQRLERLGEGRRLTNSELQRLSNSVDNLRELYRDYSRGGFSRTEVERLDQRIDAVAERIRTQNRDDDRRETPRENRNNR